MTGGRATEASTPRWTTSLASVGSRNRGLLAVLRILLIATAATVSVLAGETSGVEGTAEAGSLESAVDDSIVVTAGRVDQRIEDVPVKVTVLGEADLARSAAQTADDFLRQVPSFNLQRPGSSRVMNSSNQGVAFRGLGGTSASRTLVLVDGVPLNEPFAGWISWSRVPMATIERIEIVPGGGAGAWGNQSLGGVIHLLTRRPQVATVDASLRYGSAATLDTTVLGSHVTDRLTFTGHGSYFETAGYSDVPTQIRGPADTDSRSRATVWDGRLQLATTASTLWTLQGTLLEDRRQGGTALDRERLDLQTLRVGADRTLRNGGTLDFDLFTVDRDFASTRGALSDDRTMVTPRRDQFDVPASSVGSSFSWSRGSRQHRHLFSGGLDALWTESEIHEDSSWSGDGFRERFRSGGEQRVAGLYLQDSVSVDERWQLIGGLRLDHWESSEGFFHGESLVTGAALYDERLPARSKLVASPNLGLRYRLDERALLRAALFQSFRAPTPNELFKSTPSSRRFLAANHRLEPERIVLGAELGMDARLSAATTLRWAGFWNEIEDAIADLTVGIASDGGESIEPCGLLAAGGVCSQRQNLDQVRNRGIELDAEWRRSGPWRWAAGYSLTDSRVVESRVDPALVGKWLRRVPRHQATLQLSYDNARWLSAALQARYQGKRYEEDLNRLLIDDSVLIDLRISRQLGRQLELSLRVENLLGSEFEVGASEDYAELGYPRLVHLGLRYRWQGH